MSVFFVSDPHIGHRLVARHRFDAFSNYAGFEYPSSEAVVEWHDEVLARNWDAMVRPGEQVWVLGDLCVGGKAREQEALDWVAARNGTKHLIVGNHDSPHPMHRESHKAQARYLERDEHGKAKYFESVQQAATRRFNLPNGTKVDVRLSHYPYYADRGEGPSRDMQWRLRDEGDYLMHGHLHVAKRFNGREIHVGLDAWDLSPVPLEAISEYLMAREEQKCTVSA